MHYNLNVQFLYNLLYAYEKLYNKGTILYNSLFICPYGALSTIALKCIALKQLIYYD